MPRSYYCAVKFRKSVVMALCRDCAAAHHRRREPNNGKNARKKSTANGFGLCRELSEEFHKILSNEYLRSGTRVLILLRTAHLPKLGSFLVGVCLFACLYFACLFVVFSVVDFSES